MFNFKSKDDFFAACLYRELCEQQVRSFDLHLKWLQTHRWICPFLSEDKLSCKCPVWRPAFEVSVPVKVCKEQLPALRLVLHEIRKSWGPAFSCASLFWTQTRVLVPNVVWPINQIT